MTPAFKALYAVLGVTAAGTGAYLGGLLDPIFHPATPAAVEAPATPATPAQPEAAKPEGKAAEVPAPAQPDAKPEEKAVTDLVIPVFDLLRVEPTGDVVIAGKADAGSKVEIVSGATTLATVDADAGGDFAAVLDKPLAPGTHQIVLRATTSDGRVSTSTGTAIVNVPEQKTGEVLALVEEPGEPSRLITAAPADSSETAAATTDTAAAPAQAEAGEPAQTAPVEMAATIPPKDGEPTANAADTQTPAAAEAPAEAKPAEVAAVEPAAPAAEATAPATKPAAAFSVTIEAVEIEGDRIFVAGAGPAGSTVRIYANERLVGESAVSDGGRYLVEAQRDLAVGDYIVRADAVDANGSAVLARAAVPFTREAGESVAAVAVPAPSMSLDGPPKVNLGEGAPDPSLPAAKLPPLDNAIAAAPPSVAPAASGTPALQPADGSVIIRRGDSLWRISRRVYGRGVRYSTIYEANTDQIQDPNRIWPGQVFTVPRETPEGDTADMEALEENKG